VGVANGVANGVAKEPAKQPNGEKYLPPNHISHHRTYSTEELQAIPDDQLMNHEFHLEHTWVFWYDDRSALKDVMTAQDYENAIKNLGKFATVQVQYK
jgi:hypothetical protein